MYVYSIRSSVALNILYLSDIFMYVNSAYFSEICIKYVCSLDTLYTSKDNIIWKDEYANYM
jgi:hypothetical protein